MKKLTLFIVGCILFFQSGVTAANLIADHSITPNSGTVGDIFTYTITVLHNPKVSIRPIQLSQLDPIKVKDTQKSETMIQKKQKITQTYKLSVYKLGTHQIPTQNISYTIGKQSYQHKLPALAISIKSVLPKNQNPSLISIKPLMSLSVSWSRYIWILFSLIIGGLAIFILIKWLKSRAIQPVTGDSDVIEEDAPVEDIDIQTLEQRAIQRLQDLWAKALYDQNKDRDHYDQFTEIIKTFFSAAFKNKILEMTTSEMVSFFDSQGMSDVSKVIQSLFSGCDIVKFACYHPTPDQHEKGFKQGIWLVQQVSKFIQKKEKSELTLPEDIEQIDTEDLSDEV